MPYVPHTPREVQEMLDTIGVDSIERLFDEVPTALRAGTLSKVPEGLTELEVSRMMKARAAADGQALCFIGAGAYEHHIPAAVWQLVTRGEYYTAYTPYQAEASQGTLQLIYEYQSMMAELTAMEVSNASLYDGASALAESILMAVRSQRRSKVRRVLVPRTVHPHYRIVANTIVRNQGIVVEEVDYDRRTGAVDPKVLASISEEFTALVVPQPNFFGVLEDVDALTDFAHERGALAIGVVNPISLGVLRPPGEWGKRGADIVCGDGQPLGIPLSSGGPYFGFMCTRQDYVRQMPGRLVGRTVDATGKPGFTLTLQAREQHIRRSKATSNICTNQGLMVTAAAIYMSIMGPEGIEATAMACHANTGAVAEVLTQIKGVEMAFADSPVFHEVVLRLDADAARVLEGLAARGVLGGLSLSRHYPELGQAVLACATETKWPEDIGRYAEDLRDILSGPA